MSQEAVDITIANADVVTKYKAASDILNNAMKVVIGACKAGSKIHEICQMGDSFIQEAASKIYNKGKLLKGVAFPTAISVNNCVCHYSPLPADSIELKDGDVAKIEIGVHVDGYPALAAHSLVVGAQEVSGRKADAILAAHYALEASMRLLKPGTKNTEVGEMMQKVAQVFKCNGVEGMLSHEFQQNKLDAEKSIILNPNESQARAHKEHSFEQHEVYALDVLISTGTGKTKPHPSRTTIYKKTDSKFCMIAISNLGAYSLKLKSSREFFHKVQTSFGSMAFHLRSLEDPTRSKIGLTESIQHGLILPYDVLAESEGEIVAQFMNTVLLMPAGPLKLADIALDVSKFKSEHSLPDDIRKLVETPLRPPKKKK